MKWQALLESGFNNFEKNSKKHRLFVYLSLGLMVAAVVCLIGLMITVITYNSDGPSYSAYWLVGAVISYILGIISKRYADTLFFKSLDELNGNLEQVLAELESEVNSQ